MRCLAAIALGLLALGQAPVAHGFLLVATEDGVPTHWRQQCVPWKMSERMNNGLGWEQSHEVTTRAFQTWQEVEESYVRFEDQGTTTLNSVSLDHPIGENTLIWHGDGQWPYALHVVGLTSLTYDSDTGQIMDADIEMNADDYAFAVDGDPEAYDAQQSLTHEIGHLLGLDHSLNEDAVMYAESEPGENHKQTLHPDDIEGLAFSHPLGSQPARDGCLEPAVTAAPAKSGCATGTTPSWAYLSLALLGLWAIRRAARGRALMLGVVISLTLASGARAGQPYVTESGVPIFWPGDTMHYTLHPNLPDGLEPSAVEEAIGRGFDAWENLECQPLTLDLAGWEGCVGENSEDLVNCIRWRDRVELWSWPHHLVAVTLVHYWDDTGVIEDVDMEINAFNTSWSTALECDPDLHDLVATITHEAGHFVGLDHSQDGQATMNAATTTGDCQKRSLESDDIDTFCGTYEARPDVVIAPEPDVTGGDTDSGGAGDVAEPTTSSPPGGGCEGCSGTATSSWLSLLGITAWLRSRRRPR